MVVTAALGIFHIEVIFWIITYVLDIVTCIFLIDGLRRLKVVMGSRIFDQGLVNKPTVLIMVTCLILLMTIEMIAIIDRAVNARVFDVWVNIVQFTI